MRGKCLGTRRVVGSLADGRLEPWRFPGVRLKPLGHLSHNNSEKRSARSNHNEAACFSLFASRWVFHGQGGIRTHDTVTGIPVFETGSFSHSDTCPNRAKYCSRSEIRSQREHRADLPRPLEELSVRPAATRATSSPAPAARARTPSRAHPSRS